LRSLYAFFVDHSPCPDRHLVAAQRQTRDGSIRVRLICPACGGVQVVELTAAEGALFDSLPGHGPRQYLQ
jgi:hypothetical protein